MSLSKSPMKAALALWWAGVIAPCFAATSTAASASGCTGTTTIQNIEDASALASCATYSGDVVVATDLVTADQNHNNHLSLDGIKEIGGSLIVQNVAMLLSLSGSSLERVDYDMSFQNLSLSTIPFPKLAGVGKTFRLQDLPQLDTLTFPAEVEFGAVVINNTAIRSLDNTTFNVVSAGSVHIFNNDQLINVSVPINNGQIQTSDILFSKNGAGLNVSFPSLNAIQNMTMQDVLRIDLPNLNVVSSFMEIGGTQLEAFHADRLTNVGGALQFNNVSNLQNLSLQELSTVGSDLSINGSRALELVNFPALTRVGNNFTMEGTFSNISLPQNPQIQGVYYLESSKNISEVCKQLTTSDGVKSSQLTCIYPGSPTQAKNNSNSGHLDTIDESGLSTAAKAGIGIGIALAVVMLGALAFFLAIRRRATNPSKSNHENDRSSSTELFGLFGKIELPAEESRTTPAFTPATSESELSADFKRGKFVPSRGNDMQSRHELNAAIVYELEGDSGASEMHQREKFSFEAPREHV
ncbi:GPI-anchored cell wall organization protein Ecm33 [Acrodontium crateriforme]|uniref:GPI-anchored cell wall organization protein Ecm33 n=1 Tax=Acrodontium crateriforme TaxID=150365 RepID=A0AAQ3M4L6_9PEZI|nr:GPI-anchored cell wall organization protein Ecm33 [Acrodontium crateriforme]